jgi:hypothetical protein
MSAMPAETLPMAEGGGTGDLAIETTWGAWQHEHTHSWEDGTRHLRHGHERPTSGEDPNAARPHRHINGYHSHPHGHDGYVR